MVTESPNPAARGNENDDIVISGISGRFPESDNIEEFRQNLFNGVDMITEDGRRWTPGLYGLPLRTGKLKELNKFDATFFGVHAKQANVLDPQLRLCLELTHEAIMDAGVNPTTIRGSRTGVFTGASFKDSEEAFTQDPEFVNGYELLGGCLAMLSNRISYNFDLKGPSYSVDTACSSSMFALQQAVMSIRTGLCDAAIVCGVNVLLKPVRSLQFNRLKMLSPEGKCKAFDASGNGYVRSEATVSIYIQKASVARRSYATIVHAKTNSDGYKEEGITFPAGHIQKLLLEEVYAEAGIDPNQVSYVEAHGTGTKIGDPQELNAIAEVFGKNRPTGEPLLIGSVKSNMGHSEPASGLCSLAKVLLAMQEGVIPGNLHFESPNLDIPGLTDGRLKVVSKNHPWKGGLVGINSFGFGGANAHVVLRSYPNKKMAPLLDSLPFAIPFSGRTKEAVEYALQNLSANMPNSELLALVHEISKDDITGHGYRGYTVATNDNKSILEVQKLNNTNSTDKPLVWFIFSGMGTQWSGMARDLLKIPVMRNTFNQLAECLQKYNFDLLDLLVNGTQKSFENVLNSFVTIAAVQVALVDFLHHVGIHPDGIIGHSVGELGCAYADGCFTAEQTVLAAYARGKAFEESNLPPGGMAAVGLTWKEAKRRCPADIFPACHNAKDSVTVSGPMNSITKFVGELKFENIFAKQVESSGQAFHSSYICDVGPKLRKYLNEIILKPKPRSGKWISTSIPESAWDSSLARSSSAAYHVNNLLSPVLFQEALAHIPENSIVIEIAPHALLQAILKRSLPTSTNVGLLNKNAPDNSIQLLSSIGKLYMNGLNPNFANLYRKVEFPVGLGTPMISPLVKWDHSVSWDIASFTQNTSNVGASVITVSLSEEKDEYIAGHNIDGRILYPATGYMLLAWKAFAKIKGTTFEELPVVFENITFHRATIMQKDSPAKFLISIFDGSGEFEIQEGGSVAVSGSIKEPENVNEEFHPLRPICIPENHKFIPLNTSEVYKELRLRGYDYQGLFCGIKACDNQGNWGKLEWHDNWVTFMDTMLQFSILSSPTRGLNLPTRLQKAIIDPRTFKGFIENNAPFTHEGVPVYKYKNFNILKCPGVELRGMKSSLAPRRQQTQSSPILEESKFVCYFDKIPTTHILASTETLEDEALRTCIELVMENVPTLQLKVSEVAYNIEESLGLGIHAIIMGEPLYQDDMTVLTSKSNSQLAVEDMEKSGVRVVCNDTLENISPELGCHLVVLDQERLIFNSESSLKEGGFILVHVPTGKSISTSHFMLNLVAHKICKEQQYFLFRKKPKSSFTTNPEVIPVNNNNFEWVDKVKAAMIKASEPAEHPNIFLVNRDTPESGLLGLVHCLRQEPGGNKIKSLFIQNSPSVKVDFNEPSGILQKVIDNEMVQNIFINNEWGCYRHFPLIPVVKSKQSEALQHAYINTLTRGDLSSLRWIESPLKYFKQVDHPHEELCTVNYAPLNFRDIMLATGKLPPDALPGNLAMQDCVLGLEFSGRDSYGKRVMGLVPAKGMATTILADPNFMWEVPKTWTLEEASTVPVVYATAYYALIIRGRMRPGESVLIHSGSGGVGQAAIAIALSMNCKVFTTVGSDEKKQLLMKLFPQLKNENFANSRDCSFELDILNETKGQGVDLVLNSLSEEKLQSSVRCLAQHGRFLEIGKFDLSNNSSLGMGVFLKNITFHGILLDALFEKEAEKREVCDLVFHGIQTGTVKPLKCTVFSHEKVEEAFRYMASGKHTGKVVLKIQEENNNGPTLSVNPLQRTYFDPEKVYLIIGGLGGVGLELTAWLTNRGAKKLILVSRSGITGGYQDMCIRKWREQGILIEVQTTDATTLSGSTALIQNAMRLGHVGGIFNLAMVLKDGFMENQTAENFGAVAKPKIDATCNLDKASRQLCPNLDYFVVFSSISCGRGNAGQSNYGFANSAMERICELRQKDELPGLAIQWGAIGDVGVIQDHMCGNETIVGGTIPQRISSCLDALDYFLQQSHKAIVSSIVLVDKGTKNDNNGMKANLVESVAHILGMKDISNINDNASLAELGMDSLMGVEVKQILEREFDSVLTMQEIRQLTVIKLKEISEATLECATVV